MSITVFSEYQGLEASEKTALVVLEASRRIMGWVVHSGTIYKSTSFDHILVSVLQDGVAMNSVASIGAITPGDFFNDRSANILYMETSDSVDPNNKFIAITFKNFFSNTGGIHLEHDFASGDQVHWLPLLFSTSDFGVELDNKEFLGMALEGKGSVKFINDQGYWGDKFDKWSWDNQRIFIYSWHRDLPKTEVKILYRGITTTKKWSIKSILFNISDTLNQLRQPVTQDALSDLVSVSLTPSQRNAKQRILYGHVIAHIPSNIDATLPLGNSITGTATTTSGSKTVTGSGSAFLKELSPDDELIFGNDTVIYSVDTIASDTSLTLTDSYGGATASGKAMRILPSHPKRYQNRIHLIAGHELKEPATTVTVATKVNQFTVADDSDFFVGAQITVGSDLTVITRVSSNVIRVSPSLPTVPIATTAVILSSVWNVHLNNRLLTKTRDYTFDAATARITLDELAEFNVAPIKRATGTFTFTNTSRTVTGTGTTFNAQLQPGDWVRSTNESDWFEVLSVETDTSFTLRTASSYTDTAVGLRKRPDVYKQRDVILSLNAMGKTENGVKTGIFIGTGALAVKDLLKLAGLTSDLVEATFNTASITSPQIISLAVPESVDDKQSENVRDVIGKVNQSIFGSLFQNNDFDLEYQVIDPSRTKSFVQYIEADILALTVNTDNARISKTVRIEYLFKEYDPDSGDVSFLVEEAISQNAQWLSKTDSEFRLATILQDSSDAKVYAQRWAFLREIASSVLQVEASLKGARLQIHDRIKLIYSKLYERLSSTTNQKLAGVSAIKKDFSSAGIELDDIGNAYNRCATITENTAPIWASAADSDKILDGYITDNFGMISNDADTFGINTIW